MRMTNTIGILLCALLLTACTSLPLSTMWKLRNFDPLEANPETVRIAVITDKIVQLRDDAVSLEFGFESEQAEYNFKNLSKATVKANSSIDELNSYATPEQRITLFYLDEEAAHNMRLSQNRIQIIKENEIEGKGSFGVGIHTGCFNGPKPDMLIASVYAKFSAEQGYIKMISNINLLDQIDSGADTFWFECAKTNTTTSSP